MAKPPPPDKLPGPIKYKKPSGKPEDRPLERIHQEYQDHKRAQKAGTDSRGSATKGDADSGQPSSKGSAGRGR